MIRLILRLIPRQLTLLLILSAIIPLVVRYTVQRLAEGQRRMRSSTDSPQLFRRPAPSNYHPDDSLFEARYAVPEAYARARPVPWTARQVLISVAMIIVAFAAVFGGIIGLAEVVELSEWGRNVILLGAILIPPGIMLLSVWYFAVRPAGGRWALLGFRPVKPISTTLITIAGITICQILVVGYMQFVDWLGMDSLVPDDPFESFDIDLVSFAIIAFSAIVIAPLFEEIFFRGFMYQAFRKTMPLWPAALLTSLVFGIAHIDPAIIIPIALVGMILLGIYRWTGNLWSSIITHAGYNAIAVTALAVQTWGG